MTILGKLIADHLASDIDVDIHLIVMHHEFSSCRANWQSLCSNHHDSTKQHEEKSGKLIGNDTSGEPTHPDHHWNK